MQQGINRGGILRHLGRRQVRVVPHHLHRFPSDYFLQVVQRRAVLDQPAGPGVTQVMPAEIAYSHTHQGASPTPRVGPADRLSTVGGDLLRMLATLALQNAHGEIVK